MSKDAKFWDRHAARYAKSKISDQASYEAKLARTQELFTPETRVLEIGCGTGSTALIHAPKVAAIRAVDFSAEMIAIARDKAVAAGIDNIAFDVAGLDDLRPEDGPYDVVMAMSVLHLLDDLDQALTRIRPLVKPGGAFVSSTACLGEKMWFMKPFAPIGRAIGLMPMFKVFTRKHLEARLEANGFRIVHSWRPEKALAVFIIAERVD